MRGTIVGLVGLLLVVSLPAGCASEGTENGGTLIEASLGEEFSLPIGEEVQIAGENLRISFEDVIEDSRCPLNVTCVWEGRASSLIRYYYNDITYDVVLNEPGLIDNAQDTFDGYTITFHLKPYPVEKENISKDDYYLQLIVSKEEVASLSTGDKGEIYAAVIRQLYEVDHTLSQPPDFPVVYIISNTIDSLEDPDVPVSAPQLLSDSLRDVITDNLAKIPADIIWVSDKEEVPLNDDGSVQNGGVIVTLGNIHLEGTSVLVSASLYIAPLAATGKTYILEEIDGKWQIVGDTGVQWIS